MATKSEKMNVKAAARIYSAEANSGDGTVKKGGFGSRAMSAAMRPQVQLAPKKGNVQPSPSKP